MVGSSSSCYRLRDRRELGDTGVKVSRLCFGALTIGPLQCNLDIDAGADLIRMALDHGVNFIDTAEYYRTYPYIKQAIAGRQDVVVASKSYAFTFEGMQESIEKCLRGIDRDYVDLFMLHEQESALTLKGHRPALECLLRAKEAGTVRAVGISTHTVAAVKAATLMPEIDVVSPLINLEGWGIADGHRQDMEKAVAAAYSAGKGIYSMKPLAGGHLRNRAREAFTYLLDNPAIDSIAVGMRLPAELEMNIRIFSGCTVPVELCQQVDATQRRLHIEDWCTGCGRCVERCPTGALTLAGPDQSKAMCDHRRCLLCGYCAGVCPECAIKVI